MLIRPSFCSTQTMIWFLFSNYRAQGENAGERLENKLKELNGIALKVKTQPLKKALKVGDAAPDFQIDAERKLSDLRGSVVLISFIRRLSAERCRNPFWKGYFNLTLKKNTQCRAFFKSTDWTYFPIRGEANRNF